MNNRAYNKLYLSKNREQGNEKLVLGYQSDNTEIVLKKDHETYFHIPGYSSSIFLSASTLIQNGAIGGPFPAASDRIFQSRKNYGVTTNNGPALSSIANGMWFCSWLYRSLDGTQRWYDRYYDPGSFSSSIAVSDLLYPTYTNHNPIFEDVPSTLVLEPGLLYKYYHVGEDTAATIVNSFSGTDEQIYQVFNLTEWGTDSVDSSNNQINVTVNSPALNSELYPDIKDPQRVDSNLISFKHSSNVECYMAWDEKLITPDEFSLSFWVRSDDWANCPTTQFAGNFSSSSGIGVFVDSLSSYPLFAIPETNYGHVLIVNENGVGVTDTLTKFTSLEEAKTPKFVCVDTNHNIIICHNDNTGTIYKIDHLGTILRSSKTNDFGFVETELPLGIFCGQNNDIWVITTERIYQFDTNFSLKSTTLKQTNSTSVFAISSNSATDQYGFVFDENSIDIKFDEQTKWSISKTDFNLYKNNELFYQFLNDASSFQIDPMGRLWVLHGNNDLTVLNPSFTDETDKFVFKTDLGTNTAHSIKHISFINHYNRTTQTFEWLSLIQYADEAVLYMVDMNGQLQKTINVNNLYRNQILKELEQDPAKFEYLGQGDFTGYDHRRVFGKLAPVSDKRQLILKASLRDFEKTANDYGIFTCSCSIDGWDNKSWQNVIVTYQNRQFKLYVNGSLKSSFIHEGRYGLSFEQQPAWFFGSPVGYKNGFNKEIGSTSLIFNGFLQSAKLYNRCLQEEELILFLRSNIVAEDIYWSLPTPLTQYVEKIDRVFKHKLPGSKSPFYKIKLANFPVDDPIVKNMVKEEIKKIVEEINPGYVDFVDIEWL